MKSPKTLNKFDYFKGQVIVTSNWDMLTKWNIFECRLLAQTDNKK